MKVPTIPKPSIKTPSIPTAVKQFKPKVRKPRIRPVRPDIIVGIPTLNEAKNIENILKVVDDGLAKYFPDKKALIVNVDSGSTDKTVKLFSGYKTKSQKKTLKTPKGKGASIKELLKFYLETESAEALMIIDADITSAHPKWVRNLLTPILKGFDHCLPIYKRNEYDGALTDHLMFPVLRGILGIDIRQPLGSEVGLSRRAADRIYNRTWPSKANQYGIDIFMTLSSVFGELRIAEAHLGAKTHTLSEVQPHGMFEGTTGTMFELLDQNRHFWDGRLRVRRPPDFFTESRSKQDVPLVDVDFKSLRENSLKEFNKSKSGIKKIVKEKDFEKLTKVFKKNSRTHVSEEEWMSIVFSFICNSKVKPADRARLLKPIHFSRFLSYYQESFEKDYRSIEDGIVHQAEQFFKNRNKLVTKLAEY